MQTTSVEVLCVSDESRRKLGVPLSAKGGEGQTWSRRLSDNDNGYIYSYGGTRRMESNVLEGNARERSNCPGGLVAKLIRERMV